MIMNVKIPEIPMKANILSFSILETKVSKTSINAIIKTKKIGFV